MPLLSTVNLSKSYGPKDIFAGVSLGIPHGARIGLVGPNGVGKTTLMRILIGLEEPSGGEIQRAKDLRMGYLPQNATLDSQKTLWQESLGVFEELIAMQARLAEMEHDLGQEQNDEGLEATLNAYGHLQADFERRGGYTYEMRIRQTLTGLGFTQEDYDRPVWQLSGGQRTRALLARLLLSAPDVLLLDEPTNHLDIAATEWLEVIPAHLEWGSHAHFARPLLPRPGGECDYRNDSCRQPVPRQLQLLSSAAPGALGPLAANL